MKVFNTTAVCVPSKHYMVDLTERVEEIKKLVDSGKYFTINRARQYGKTTTLTALYYALQKDYTVVSLSFEGISDSNFASEQTFVKAFCRKLLRETRTGLVLPDQVKEQISDFLSRKEEPCGKSGRNARRPLIFRFDFVTMRASFELRGSRRRDVEVLATPLLARKHT